MLIHRTMAFAAASLAAVALGACAAPPSGDGTGASVSPPTSVGAGTPVQAAVETVPVGTENADAADDPAIWADPADPSRLVVFGQRDSAFAVWRVDGDAPAYRGRFSVVSGNGIDAVTGTDGIAALGGQAGSFPQGLVVVQDDVDEAPGSAGERQNFKFVDWRAIKAALGLD